MNDIKPAGAEKELFLIGPIGEFIIDGDGNHLSCDIWRDRLDNCFLNGAPVTENEYKRMKNG